MICQNGPLGIYHVHDDIVQESLRDLLSEWTHWELLGLRPEYCLIWIPGVWFNITAAHYLGVRVKSPKHDNTVQRADTSLLPVCFHGWLCLTVLQPAQRFKKEAKFLERRRRLYQKPHEFLQTVPQILEKSRTNGQQRVGRLWAHSGVHQDRAPGHRTWGIRTSPWLLYTSLPHWAEITPALAERRDSFHVSCYLIFTQLIQKRIL